MSKLLVRLVQLLAAGCISAAYALPVQAQALQPLKIRLDWTPWAGHAAFHLAQVKGWYKQAGLDVSLEDGNGSVTAVQLVGSSDQFDAGHAALSSMMVARAKGLSVKAIAVFLHQNDLGLLVPANGAIKGPADLKGKKVVYTAGSLEAPFIDAFLAAGKLKRDDVDLLSVDASAKVTTYGIGRADAAFSTIPYLINSVSKTRPSKAIHFADFGLNVPSFGIFTTEDKLKTKRDALSRFASVTAATWQYIIDGHQSEAVDAIVADRPQSRLDKKELTDQLNALIEFMPSPASKGTPFGVPVPSEWDVAVQTLEKIDLIKPGSNPKDYYVPGMVTPYTLPGAKAH